MREFITFLTACIVLAIAQSLVTALVAVLVLFALMAAISHPRQTFGFGLCLGLLTLAFKAPVAAAAALALFGLSLLVASMMRERATRSAITVTPARLPPPTPTEK